MDLNKKEEDILLYWKNNDIYNLVKESNKGGKKFYFLDGPPYVSGELHPGQVWVKARKDLFLRYKRFRGYNVYDKAGYDVHGLPIEHKIEVNLGLQNKKEIETKIGVGNFIRYCREYVDSLIGKMNADFERFGVWLDFKNAYLPYKNEYIEAAWKVFKLIAEKGFLYKDKRPMLYCPKCETVLAQGTLEVEYGDEDDPSIFVAFEVDQKASKAKIEIKDDTYIIVWTTTPWTLVANMSVAVNPVEKYVIANIRGKHYIFASARLDAVVAALGESAIIEAEFLGSELEGMRYINPLEKNVPIQKELRKYHKVLMSKTLVSMSEGSGVVHVAPGHGFEDFLLGKENKIPPFSPLDEHARYTEDAGEFVGLNVPAEANKRILEVLEANGSLLSSGTVRHSYPHCWRCGSKLVYVSTDQWFLNVNKVKGKLLKENKKVKWYPSEAQSWQEDVLQKSPDWVISRQRYWDIPLPIWVCSKCGNNVVIGSVDEMKRMAIGKVDISDLHRPNVDNIVLKCPKCGAEMHRVSDIFDVWFDSGIAFRASLSDSEFERLYPADFILEGVDQLRGWFSTLLKSSVMAYGKAPFKSVSVDGMMVGEDGREMHKHLGNYISLHEMLKIASADAFRLWSLRHTHWLDLSFNRAELGDSTRFLLLLYNIENLIKEYAEAVAYTPAKIKRPRIGIDADLEDTWVLSRLNSMLKEITAYLEEYSDYKAINALVNFVLEDFSRFYLRLAKRKILFRSRAVAKRTIDIINYVFYNALVALSPAIPFTTEAIYLSLYGSKKSIFLEKWPKADEKLINKEIESDFKIGLSATSAILSSREKAGIKLRWPLSKATVEVTDDAAYSSLQRLAGIIENIVNVKKLELVRVRGIKREVRPVYAAIGPEFKENAKVVAEALKDADADEVEAKVAAEGSYLLHTERGVFEINNRHFTVIEKALKEDAVMFKYGVAYVSSGVNVELRDEALMRELERRVQMLRKELGLKKKDKILLGIAAVGEIENIVSKNRKELAKNLNAQSIEEEINAPQLSREFEIEGSKVYITIKKAE